MNEPAPEDREALRAIGAIARGLGEDWLIAQRRCGGPIAAKTIQRLRKDFGSMAARWLVEFAAAHGKAVEKFGEGGWLTTRRSVQQASDRWTAAYKASRFPAGEPIVDLCCGVGGDAIALARRAPTLAIDRDPQVARMAAANLREAFAPTSGTPLAAADVLVAALDAETLLPFPPGRFLHLDPDRRPGERRTIDPACYQPTLEIVERTLENAAGAAVKLAPAARVSVAWQRRCEREWISFRGSVRQQVAWFGALCGASGGGSCRATRLRPGGVVDSFAVASEKRTTAIASTASTEHPLIADFDPAVRAAGLSASLAGTLGFRAIGGPAGFFAASRLDRLHPLAEIYEVLWSGAGNMKAMEAGVKASGARIDTIKVRGASIRPEKIQKKIRQAAIEAPKCEAALLIGCLGKRFYAVIGKRLVSGADRQTRA